MTNATSIKYLSVCSGIEAASVAWHHLGWTPVGFSEIEPFPSAVLAHRFPQVPNYGDMTQNERWPIAPGSVDLLVGGTPCQSFSVAGLRRGLADPRGNLMLTYLAIAARLKPRWIVWENVPGVLSSGGGRDFGSFLGALGELGYGWAYRVLDAQFVRVGRWPRAVPQRRRRVFVVGCLGEWTAPAEVLALGEGMQRHTPTRRAAGQAVAADAEGGVGGGVWAAEVASTLNHAFGDKQGLEDQHALHGAPLFVPAVVGALTAKGPEAMGAPEVDAQHYVAHRATWWDGSEIATTLTRKGSDDRMPDKDRLFAVLQPTWPAEVCATLASRSAGGTPGTTDQELFAQGASCIVPIQDGRDIAKSQNGLGIGQPGDPGYTLDTTGAQAVAVSVDLQNVNMGGDVSGTLDTTRPSRGGGQAVAFTVDMQACKGNANVGDGSVSPTLCKPSGNDVHAVAFTQNCREEVRDLGGASSALTGQGTHQQTYIAQPVACRDVSPTLTQRMQGSSGWAPVNEDAHFVAQVQPVPYDLFQITAPVNRQNRKPGDPCHTLARDNAAHAAIAIQGTLVGRDAGGPQGVVASQDGSMYTLTKADIHAVAFKTGNSAKARSNGESAEVTPTLGSDAGGNTIPAVAIGTDCYNGAITGDVAATMGTPGSSVNASGPTVMSFYPTGGSHGLHDLRDVSPAVKVGSGLGIPSPPAIAHTLSAEGHDASEDGTGRGTPLVPVAPSLTASNDPSRSPQSSEVTAQVAAVHAAAMAVRRLTPRECERLQGFPDDWTLIPWRGKPAAECPDGPRYKALGNSMACNCMAWIGERIAAHERV